MTRLARFSTLLLVLSSLACGSRPDAESTTPEPTSRVEQRHDGIPRLRVNQLALRLDLPLFWHADTDGDGAVDPDEVRSLRFYPEPAAWVQDGRFTPAFEEAWQRIVAESREPAPEDERRRLVREELDRAAPTLVHTDLSEAPETHRTFAVHMLRVADAVDAIYAKQVGMTALEARLPEDVESRSLFRRNWGPKCRGNTTEANPACSAIAGAPGQPVDVYPADMQEDDAFCTTLEERADAAELLTPFTVVRERDGALVAVPYTEAYADEMGAIARELDAAADAMTDPEERALVAYLRAAAQAFRTNDWEPADEAWSRMNARNSSWYVRVGPDETYWDPCSRKAGFHLTLALVNRDSLSWQDRLTPLQQDMERSLAALVSDAYEPRDVQFHMPDFIDIVVNAGDDRDAFGATIGQSLPNWGLVAEEGRGRTVAMSNLYTDPDSQQMRRAQAASLLSAETMGSYTSSPTPGLLSTILHEATHNLGPAHEYRVNGQTADDAFGGGMASMLEELKAQSGALYFLELLEERGVIDEQAQREAYLDSIVWAFGHISRGMYAPGGQRKAYSQLSAIQVGFLLDEGALSYDPAAAAADGSHQGAFTIHFEHMPEASRKLMELVMRIKATNDRARAEELAARYVDGDRVPQAMIVERYRDFPRQSFVYSVELE